MDFKSIVVYFSNKNIELFKKGIIFEGYYNKEDLIFLKKNDNEKNYISNSSFFEF